MIWAQVWTEIQTLPPFISRHVLITLCALAAGIAISVPLGVVAHRVPKLAGPILSAAGIIQTIPSLALLALMVPIIGNIGFVPALLALMLYSILPTLRNTVTGLDDVDPTVVEAATGIGMTPFQVLTKVRLPLALPVIIAGIRTAAVWTVSIATLTTLVGASSLGNPILSGLQTQNHASVVAGCIAAALLALGLDGTIRLLEISVADRNRKAGAVGVAILLVGLAIGLGPGVTQRRADVVIGAKRFTEQYILARLVERQLKAAGLRVDVRENFGSTILFDALSQDNVQVYVEYSGTAWANYMDRDGNPGAEAMFAEVSAWLAEEHDVTVLGALGFANLYTVAMARERANELGISTIGHLAQRAPDLRLASDVEFFGRPEWPALRDTYGLDFHEEIGMESGLMYTAVADGNVDAITAYSTDGRIDAFDLITLEDPREAFLPYDAMLLLSPSAARDPRIVEALRPLIGAIDNPTMRSSNRIVDVDKEPIDAAVDRLEALLVEAAR